MKKLLLIPLLAICLILVMQMGSAGICYQESTNVSNQTGIDFCRTNITLLYNGTNSNSSLITNPNNCWDGSFNTYCDSS